jgi:hypothetical protein
MTVVGAEAMRRKETEMERERIKRSGGWGDVQGWGQKERILGRGVSTPTPDIRAIS